MKKLGFTLAEVLITLGIIGVVAALTAPALVQNAGSAQIGPKLAKAVSTLELANQNMLTESGAASMSSYMSSVIEAAEDSANDTNDVSKIYLENELPKYMKITYMGETRLKYRDKLMTYNGESKAMDAGGLPANVLNSMKSAISDRIALSKDGFLYGVYFGTARVVKLTGNKPAHMTPIGTVVIDINGLDEPNRFGRDVFLFVMYNDGCLKPAGSLNWFVGATNIATENFDKLYNWEDGTVDLCNAEEVKNGWTCAGSIFENNLKVIYQ